MKGKPESFCKRFGRTKSDWRKWSYQTLLKLSIANKVEIPIRGRKMTQDSLDGIANAKVDLRLNFLHLVIILQKEKILKCILSSTCKGNAENNFTSIEVWTRPVFLNLPKTAMADLVEEDRWILKANCFHLAARFFPKGLQILLAHFEQIHGGGTIQEGGELKSLFQQAQKERCLTPLHVAASMHDPLSTR